MLADDDSHIGRLRFWLLTFLPLAPLLVIVVGELILLAAGSERGPAAQPSAGHALPENSLDQPLVIGVTAGEEGSPALNWCDRASYLIRTPVSVWRQAAAACELVISLGSFVGLMIASYMFKSNEHIVPRDESLGLFCLTLSSASACFFYRREVKKPLAALRIRLSTKRHSGSARDFVMLCFWICILAVEAYRVVVTALLYRSDWVYMYRTFCVLQLLADFVCCVVAISAIALFMKRTKLLEDIGSDVIRVYGSDCAAHVEPATSKPPNPEARAGLFELLTFLWVRKVLRKGRKEQLTHQDLYAMKDDEVAAISYARFARVWEIRSRGMATPTSASLYGVLWDFLNPSFCFASVLKIVYDSLSMLDVLLINLLVKHMSSDDSWHVGLTLCALLALDAYSETFLLNQYFHRMLSAGISVRSCLATAVYLKALRVDSSQLGIEAAEFTSGKTINLMSTDAQRVGDVMTYIQVLWSGPFQIALSSVMLYKQLGPAAFGGIGIMILGIPLTATFTRKTRKLQKSMMELKDERLKTTSELIQGIRAIKIYAWEIPFQRLINGIRGEELHVLKKSQITNSYSRFMINAIPIAVAIVSFTIFATAQHGELTPAVAFTSLALFENLRFPLLSLPTVIMAAAEASVTIRRLQTFMGLPELKTRHTTQCKTSQEIDQDTRVAVSCKNLNVNFSSDEAASSHPPSSSAHSEQSPPPVKPPLMSHDLIQNISMTLRLGEYFVLVGRTGCGKSALFDTILGEVDTVRSGSMELRGSVALCTQSAWIRSGSVRDNILFGKPYRANWYAQVVEACALKADFKVLTDGDQTEIGERGVNLSGGQKQRIALARAVYFDADLYLLDDILSAVDAHVALHIYKKVIRGLLRRKAVLLATHRFECLGEADRIYMLRRHAAPIVFHSVAAARRSREFQALADEHGRQLENSPSTSSVPDTPVVNRSESLFSERVTPIPRSPRVSLELSQCGSKDLEKEVLEAAAEIDEGASVSEEDLVEGHTLVKAEAMQEGKVSAKVYLSYVRAGGGWLAVVTLMVLLCGSAVASLGASFWLSHWSDHATTIKASIGLLWYGVIQCGGLVVLVGALIMIIAITQWAARAYHGHMLSRIIHAKMKFFEATPIGRLTNKFSKDLYTIDELLPMTLYMFLSMLVQVAGILMAIAVVLPIMLVVIGPVLVVYYWTERLYVAVARQFKRLDSVSRSPLFTHFAESLDGARTIRAMRQKGQFLGIHLRYLDENLSAAYIYIASNRWLSVRLESLGNLIVSGVAIFCVVLRSHLSGGKAGVALSYSLRVTGFLNWLVRMSGDRESNIVAVERVIEYDDDENCPQEDYERKMLLPRDEGELKRSDSSKPRRSLVTKLPLMQCPAEGEVELVDVSLRYRPELPFALRNVSFKIARAEKVGIVGRTGAGKSSLLVCLLRLVELTEGSILVHGVNALEFAVDQLREEISIIPQDSVIFSGTLRRNLDPFGRRSDEELWAALRKACLEDFAHSLPGELEFLITENGANISVGQRQLICLARVLLKRSSVLLLDEATSAVDPQTDALIQKCLREEFNETTIITIAHRLKTVIDYDRIIVMANGSILESGAPAALLGDSSSEFYKMYNNSS